MDDETLERQTTDAQNTVYDRVAKTCDQRAWNWARRNFPKLVSRPDLPRDCMTGADYIKARALDRDPMGRRIK